MCRVRLLLPVSVVPQYVNKCNKRRGGWVGGWMTWLFIGTDLHSVCMCTAASNYETRGSCPGGAVRIFSGQPSSVPIPLPLRAGCSGDYATSGVSCRKEKYIRRPFDISPILELVWQSLSSYVR